VSAEDPPTPDEGASSLRRDSSLVASGILLSRLAGLVREKLTAQFLGANVGAEAFRAALKIPNLLQNLLGEGVLSASFIPVHAKMLAEGRDEDAGRLAGAIAGLLALLAGALVLIGVLFAPQLTRIIAPGFPPGSDRYGLTVTLVRILTPGVGFLVLSAWCLGVLNSHRRFFLSYVAPVMWNVAIIAALVGAGLAGLGEIEIATAMGWGVLVGGVLQFAVQLPTVVRLSPGLRPSASFKVPGVTAVARAFGPVVAGRGVVQLSAYIDLFVASLLATGAVAALGYAQVLYLLPISLFGMSVAAAELPALSTIDHDDLQRVTARLEEGLARMAFFVVPSAVAFVLLGDQVVRTLYEGGRFTPEDTRQVGMVLAAYGLGLLASTATRLLQSALYGIGDTRRPAILAAVRVGVATVVGVLLMMPLDLVEIVPGDGLRVIGQADELGIADEAARSASQNQLRLGAVGLALGAGVGAWLEFVLLRRVIRRRFGPVRLGGGRLGRTLVASIPLAIVGTLMRPVVADLPGLIGGPLALVAAGAAYLLAALALGLPEASQLREHLARRLRRLGPRRGG
jgi:putative peptidoglycan lipid II flippase